MSRQSSSRVKTGRARCPEAVLLIGPIKADDPQFVDLKSGNSLEIDAEIDRVFPRSPISVTIRRADGGDLSFVVTSAIETMAEVETLKAGGYCLSS